MALQQRRPYVIYDKVVGGFLAEFRERAPLKSGWTGFADESPFLIGVQTFDTKREAERVLGKLSKAFAEEPGGSHFVILRVKPFVGYELEKWPAYISKPYLL